MFRQKQLLKKALLADQNSHMIFRASGELLLSSVKEASAEARIKDICQKYISSVRLCPHQQIIKKIAGSLYEINIDNTLLEDESFILFTIVRKKRLFEESDHTISVYDNVQEASSVDNAIGNNSANLVGEVRTLIERYAATPYPIVITGESGTGKTKAAELLYAGGKFSTRPYYTINCRLMTKEKWDQLLNDECSPLGNNGVTINFLDLQAVTSLVMQLYYRHLSPQAQQDDLFHITARHRRDRHEGPPCQSFFLPFIESIASQRKGQRHPQHFNNISEPHQRKPRKTNHRFSTFCHGTDEELLLARQSQSISSNY